MSAPWLQRFHARPQAKARLFCFPHAGGGAAAFRLWALRAAPEVEVLAVQLPGRGTRFQEPSLESIPAIVDALVPAMLAELDRPYALLGHSMGSVVAFATLQALARRGAPLPAHLFVSARRPPRLPNPESPMHVLTDAAFVEEMKRRYGGIPAEVLAEPDLLALLLPSLRADMRALETYVPGPAVPLATPITALGGDADLRAPLADLQAWREETQGAFRVRQFEGGHFYLEAHREALLAEVAAALAPATASAAVAAGA